MVVIPRFYQIVTTLCRIITVLAFRFFQKKMYETNPAHATVYDHKVFYRYFPEIVLHCSVKDTTRQSINQTKKQMKPDSVGSASQFRTFFINMIKMRLVKFYKT